MFNTIILQTHQLKKHFGTAHAVEEVNLSVASRKIYGFLGPTGPARPPLSVCSWVSSTPPPDRSKSGASP